MPKINLSTIQQTANTKYSDFEVELPTGQTAVFSAILRLPKAKRRELREAMDLAARAEQPESAELDMFDIYRDAFRIVAKSPSAFELLDSTVGDDPAMWQELFTAFTEDTQAGEA
jgi:Mycobacteriophage tail assembly protein